MVNLILYTISCIGLCFILKYGSILEFLRNRLVKYHYFKELFACSLCLGFWSGACTGLIGQYNIFIFATYGAAVCWYADFILDVIVKHGKKPTLTTSNQPGMTVAKPNKPF